MGKKKENELTVEYNELKRRNEYRLNGVDVTETMELIKARWEKEIVETKCKLFQLDMSIQKRLQDQLALTEKALELACNKIEHIFESDYSTAWFYAEDNKTIIERDKFEDYFKTKSKEMMKSE